MDIFNIDVGLKIPFPFNIEKEEGIYHYNIKFTDSSSIKYVVDPPSISHDALYKRIVNKCPILHDILNQHNNCLTVMGPLLCQAMYTELITETNIDLFIYGADVSEVIEAVIKVVKYNFNFVTLTVGHDVFTIVVDNFVFNIYLRIYADIYSILRSCNVPNYSVATTAHTTYIHKNAIIAHVFRIIPLTLKFKVDINSIVKLINCGFTATVISNVKTVHLAQYIDGLNITIDRDIMIDININHLKTRVTLNYLVDDLSEILAANIYSFIYHDTLSNKKISLESYVLTPINKINNSPPKLTISRVCPKIDYKKCVHCGVKIEVDEALYFKNGAKKICAECGVFDGIIQRKVYNMLKYEPSMEISCGHKLCLKNSGNNVYRRYIDEDNKVLCWCGLNIQLII